MRAGARATIMALALAGWPASGAELVPYRIERGAIDAPLAAPGDAARGRTLVLGRDTNCTLCHVVPDAGGRPAGNLGPPLAGAGARYTAGELRLRIVDSLALNPATIMPSYYRVEGLANVAAPYRGQPILDAQQVEDVVAFLRTQ